MILATKTFFPPLEEYQIQLKRIWENEWITNRGELVIELEEKLKSHLGVSSILITNNGTIPLQIALKILAKNIMQSYSLMPSINPKTRNSNKQFFSQGNDKITKEGTGDILEFTLQEFDIAKITSLNLQSNNIKNFALNNLVIKILYIVKIKLNLIINYS